MENKCKDICQVDGICIEKEKHKDIMYAMTKAGDLKKPGTGIIFTVPVTNLIGLHHREEFEDE